MRLSWLVAGAVRGYLRALPPAYAGKTARKLRFYLDAYGGELEEYQSPAGGLRIGGLRRTVGEPADITIKEPETVRWIDACVKDDDVLWDVGANIGLYSLYAARRGIQTVFAFEPFGATYVQLQKNLIANGADRAVRALNIALSDQSSIATLNLQSFEAGYATSLAGHEVEASSQRIGTQHVMALRADDLVRFVPGAHPDHVKIDVDGAEPLVLAGLKPLLPTVRSLFIEVLEEFTDRFEREFVPMLAEAGLTEVPVRPPHKARNRAFVRADSLPAVTSV